MSVPKTSRATYINERFHLIKDIFADPNTKRATEIDGTFTTIKDGMICNNRCSKTLPK